MRQPYLLLLISCLVALSAARADWLPNTDDPKQVEAKAALEQLLVAKPQVQEFFDQAYAYAVFPSVKRFGAMFGFAWGGGVVIQDDQHLGNCSQFVVDLGPQLGVQAYSQVIFFQDEQSLKTFQEGRFEFQGRASGVFFTWGGAKDPSYLPDVAIFSLMKGGLMFEAAAGPAKYGYKPID